MGEEEVSPIEKLKKALTVFANEIYDGENGPIMVGSAIMVWEEMVYFPDGKIGRALRYSMVTDGTGMASSVGLAHWAREQITTDLLDKE